MQNPLIQILKSQELLNEEQLAQALEAENETGWPLDKVLVQRGYLSEHDLLRALSDGLGMRYEENLGAVTVPVT